MGSNGYMFNTHDLRVMIGSNSMLKNSTDSIFLDISEMIIHEENNNRDLINDIALIKTNQTIDFIINNKQFLVNSLCILQKDYKVIGKAEVAGWGITNIDTKSEPDYLQTTTQLAINDIDCDKVYTGSHCVGRNPTAKHWSGLKTEMCYLADAPPILGTFDSFRITNMGMNSLLQ